MTRVITANVNSFMPNIIVHIRLTGLRTLAFRLWLGRIVLRLGCHIIGCGVVFENGSDQ
jgi:hypothetical protein